jgi:quercetin 2,3-dioxygenase
MLNVQRAEATSVFRRGPFQIRRVRPGAVQGSGVDPALGPLSAIDHANLDVGTRVAMHQHRNDEILSYLWRGVMIHEDSDGNRVELSSRRLMMMNAGSGFWHEESTPAEPVEMLQIFVRPEAPELSPQVTFWDRPDGLERQGWKLIAGPEGSEAPLTFRQRVMVFDAHAGAEEDLTVPVHAGMVQWLYVMDGSIIVGGQQVHKGDAILDAAAPLPPVRAISDATLVAFLVDLTATASRAGTISGH